MEFMGGEKKKISILNIVQTEISERQLDAAVGRRINSNTNIAGRKS